MVEPPHRAVIVHQDATYIYYRSIFQRVTGVPAGWIRAAFAYHTGRRPRFDMEAEPCHPLQQAILTARWRAENG